MRAIISGTMERGAAEHSARWLERFWTALEPHTTGAHVNFLSDESSDRVKTAYSPAAYARLNELKRTYDPENLLALNQNIEP